MRSAASAAAVTAAVMLVAGALASAQSSFPLAEDVFKNVQILKGLPVDQFMGTMGFFAAATGLNCTDCHVDESGGNWAKYTDDNTLKRTTRRMMQMVTALNSASFGGRQMVTCNTCHRGNRKPNVMPSLVQLYGTPPPDEPGDPFVQAPGQPPADQILDQYIAASGGARVAALTSLSAKGTYRAFDDADNNPLELFAKAPGLRTTIVHSPAGETTTAFDGRAGWIAAPDVEKPVPLLALTGQELDGVKLEAALWFPVRVKELLRNWRTGVPVTIADRDARIVQGTTTGGATVTLCFDAQSGLLVRMVRFAESPVGRLVTQVDYTDYRDVAGVKLPFHWTVTWLGGRSVYELADVLPNVPIDDRKFAKPPASRR